ncbi:MAG: hypothetical protein AAGC60_19705 [Acidobacteriota bacterium]
MTSTFWADSAFATLTGVISGLIATFLVFVLRAIWIRIIEPWYEEKVYQDARIEGTWLSEIRFPAGEVNKHRMTINQVGHKISGRTICYEGYSEGQSYLLSGTFHNLILTITYRIDNPRRIERGSLVLMLFDDGKQLKGQVSFYDDKQHRILTTECSWVAELPADSVQKGLSEEAQDD